MKKTRLTLLLLSLGMVFAVNSGFNIHAAYDFTNKIDATLSGVDYAYNYHEGSPGIGLGYAFTTAGIGFSIDGTYFADKTVDSYTVLGITIPNSDPKPKISQTVVQLNAELPVTDMLSIHGGINYPFFNFSNTTATATGTIGYQIGATLALSFMSLDATYQVLNANATSSSGTFTENGIVVAGKLAL